MRRADPRGCDSLSSISSPNGSWTGIDYRYAGQPVPISCSLGVAGLDRTMGKPDDLFLAADRALYRSKEEGGNRVTVAAE